MTTMEPLNRPYRNRDEANGESMIPVDRQPDDLRTRIAAVLNSHKADDRYDEWSDCQCGNVGTRWDDHVADAVIRELGPIPDRCHVDDQGRVWEWCGGQPGTWAWRITRLDNR